MSVPPEAITCNDYDSSWNVLSETVALSHFKTKQDYNRFQKMSNKVFNRSCDSDDTTSVWNSSKMFHTNDSCSTRACNEAEAKCGNRSPARRLKVCGYDEACTSKGTHTDESRWSISRLNGTNAPGTGQHSIQVEPSKEDRCEQHSSSNSSNIKAFEVMTCVRCGETVYPKELVEPRRGVPFHQWCLRCDDCGHKLTLNTFVSNPRDSNDPRVFCKNHVPQLEAARMDHQAVCGFQQVPKIGTFNKEIRGPDAGKAARYDKGALCIQVALKAPKLTEKVCPKPSASPVVKSDVIGLRYF